MCSTLFSGVQHYIRKCSSDIRMQMPVFLVCMKESRPGDGHLCFCKKNNCNSAPGTPRPFHTSSKAPLLVLGFLTLLLIEGWFSGDSVVTKWVMSWWNTARHLVVLVLGFTATMSKATTTCFISIFTKMAAYTANFVMNDIDLSQSDAVPKG